MVGVGGEAAIFSFSKELQVRQEFTPDLGRLTRALRRIEFSVGPDHVIDATLAAMRLLDQRPKGRRRILLLISEPRDQGSQSSLHDALDDSSASNTLIYWLNVARGAAPEGCGADFEPLYRRAAISFAEIAKRWSARLRRSARKSTASIC